MKVTTFELEVVEGPNQIRVTLTDKSTHPAQRTAIESPVFLERADKRMALKCFGVNLAYIIRQRLWPKDTEVYDTVTTHYGKKVTNPHYPE